MFQPPGLDMVDGDHVDALLQALSTSVSGRPVMLLVRPGLLMRRWPQLDHVCTLLLAHTCLKCRPPLPPYCHFVMRIT